MKRMLSAVLTTVLVLSIVAFSYADSAYSVLQSILSDNKLLGEGHVSIPDYLTDATVSIGFVINTRLIAIYGKNSSNEDEVTIWQTDDIKTFYTCLCFVCREFDFLTNLSNYGFEIFVSSDENNSFSITNANDAKELENLIEGILSSD